MLRDAEKAYAASSQIQIALQDMWNYSRGDNYLQHSIEYMMTTMHFIRTTRFPEQFSEQQKRMQSSHV